MDKNKSFKKEQVTKMKYPRIFAREKHQFIFEYLLENEGTVLEVDKLLAWVERSETLVRDEYESDPDDDYYE